MREELIRRNYAGTTIHSYLKAVEHFQQHVNRPFEELGADDCHPRFKTPAFSPAT
jgi:hypothetical protein